MPERTRFEPQRRARRRALQALYQWQMTGQSADEIIRQFLGSQDFSNVDLALFKSLVNGVIRDHHDLEQGIQPFMDRPFGRCDVMERVILLIGAQQLQDEQTLPYQVVLEECIDLAHRFGSDQSPVYVNAVLDKAAHAWRNQRAASP